MEWTRSAVCELPTLASVASMVCLKPSALLSSRARMPQIWSPMSLICIVTVMWGGEGDAGAGRV